MPEQQPAFDINSIIGSIREFVGLQEKTCVTLVIDLMCQDMCADHPPRQIVRYNVEQFTNPRTVSKRLDVTRTWEDYPEALAAAMPIQKDLKNPLSDVNHKAFEYFGIDIRSFIIWIKAQKNAAIEVLNNYIGARGALPGDGPDGWLEMHIKVVDNDDLEGKTIMNDRFELSNDLRSSKSNYEVEAPIRYIEDCFNLIDSHSILA